MRYAQCQQGDTALRLAEFSTLAAGAGVTGARRLHASMDPGREYIHPRCRPCAGTAISSHSLLFDLYLRALFAGGPGAGSRPEERPDPASSRAVAAPRLGDLDPALRSTARVDRPGGELVLRRRVSAGAGRHVDPRRVARPG